MRLGNDDYLEPRTLAPHALESTIPQVSCADPSPEAACFFWHEMALFIGPALRSAPHGHFCVELTLALDGELEVNPEGGGGATGLGGVLIGSNVPHHHRMHGSRAAQLIVGPLTTPGMALRASLGTRPIGFIRPANVEPFRAALHRLIGCDDIAAALRVARSLVRHFSALGPVAPADGRVLQAMHRLLRDFTLNTPVREFAEEAGLSESRLSHLFRTHVGVPLRTYRRWLRLRAGVLFGLSGWDLAAAANEAGFSDQADFSRACREAFGVAPSVIVQAPTSLWVGETPAGRGLMPDLTAGSIKSVTRKGKRP